MGLERWSWYQLEGSEGIKTRVVSVFAPTGSSASREETYWKQQVRYIIKKGLKTNPKEIFRKDLLRQLRQWRSKREQMVLMMEANKGVIDGVMCRQLRKADVGMREAVHTVTAGKGPNTYFKGSEAIDSIWTTTEIEVTSRSNECRLSAI